ncbi:MAG: hypothetical protein Q9M31_09355 [Mariprofundus sp.]|nr:hypothetical protein [Mariprofundus sp.]
MSNFPNTERKLQNRVVSYRAALKKEKATFGCINDGGGRRYMLFYLYFVMDDLKKSRAYFRWYKKEFPNDVGEPTQKLCHAFSLHRMKKEAEAKHSLAELMLSNLYIIPHLLGHKLQEHDMWHASSYDSMDYIEYIPEEVIGSITLEEIQWMKTLYGSFEFRRMQERYIEIYHKLQTAKGVEQRTTLLNESYALLTDTDCENNND